MRTLKSICVNCLSNQRYRYVIGGGFNTVVNYVLGAAIYQALLPKLNFFIVAAIVTVVAISISFVTHKLFVFRSDGKWWVEYLRSYIVYGSSAVINIGFMWLLLHWAHANVWLAQAIVTAFAIVVSYIGHFSFTFRSDKKPDREGAPL